MRRALSVIVLLALMAGFGFGVNRLIASRKHKIPTEASVFIPTAERPKIVLPGTLYLAQNGDIYRLSDGFFTDLHLSTSSGSWMQPAYIPNSQDIVAVLRAAEYSNLYLLNGQGTIIRRLSNNAYPKIGKVYLNHWMFYPHVGANGNTIYFSYDQPKDSATYAVDFSVWTGALNGTLAGKELTVANPFTGGDVDATPMANGSVIYSKYAIGSGNAYSQIAIQVKPLGNPIILTTPTQDCGQPSPSPDGTKVAMICIGGTGLQSTRTRGRNPHQGKAGDTRNARQQLSLYGPGVVAGRNRARLLQHRRYHRAFRALVDQGSGERRTVATTPGDDEPRLRRNIAAELVTAEQRARDVALETV